MIALSVAKLKMFSPESEILLWIKPKKKKNNFFVESLDQSRGLEVREKARNAFCDEPTSVWPQDVKQHHMFVKFFRFRADFLAFSPNFRQNLENSTIGSWLARVRRVMDARRRLLSTSES